MPGGDSESGAGANCFDHGSEHVVMVLLLQMSEGSSSREENANLYIRGANEGRTGEPLNDMQVLEILEVFGIEGLRSYIVGHMEGVAEAAVEGEEG
jgi:hypothetical protein